jgi:hypothetical protein
MRSGILIAIVGAWLVLRTARKDATGRNLVDRILGGGDTSPATTTDAPTPRAPSAKPVTDPGTLRVPSPSPSVLVHPVSRM